MLLALFAVSIILYKVFDLPSYEEINAKIELAFAVHGYWVVFIGALAEGILFANWYLPGSVVVVMGVAFAQQSGLNVFGVVSLITLGFFITTLLNYALGRFGWYRLLMKFGLESAITKTKNRLEKHGHKIIFGTYFHPNMGALTATSAGILRLPFKPFVVYSFLALAFWNSFWSLLVYISGPAIVDLITFKSLFIIVSMWLVVLFVIFIRKQGKELAPVMEEPTEQNEAKI